MNLIKKTIRDSLKTPGFTVLYIIGVAFTIAFTIVYGILLYGQLGPVYPEYDRNNTAYIDMAIVRQKWGTSSQALGQPFVEEFLRDSVKSIESMTALIGYHNGDDMVQPIDGSEEFPVYVVAVEPSFFDFYKYEFKAGAPFTQDDFEAKARTVVISDKVARRLFPTLEDAVGEKITINYKEYPIVGVFREGSAMCMDSYGEVFIPYSRSLHNYNREWPEQYIGSLKAVMKVRPGMENKLREEIQEICRRINLVDTAAPKFHIPRIESHAEHVLAPVEIDKSSEEFVIAEATSPLRLWRPFLIALLVVLVIPALNISGLIAARMDRMQAELGIRRGFGATKHQLIGMVMRENLVLTLTGGVIGLILAWIITSTAGNFLLQLTPMGNFSSSSFGSGASIVTGEMAFAPLLFVSALAICLVLNILSAWIPARRAMSRQITESINSNR